MSNCTMVPMSSQEKKRLLKSLESNAEGSSCLTMGKDTSFTGTSDEVTDDEVINVIKSVPCHY